MTGLRRLHQAVLTAAAAFIAVGCDPLLPIDGSDETNVQTAGPAMGLAVPDVLLSSRMIDINQTTPSVTIAGNNVPMTRQGAQWTGQFSLPGPGSHPLVIRWTEQFNGQPLPLAEATVMVSDQSPRNIGNPTYNTNQFDFDGDTVSNLDERNAGTSPLVPGNDTGDSGTAMVGSHQTDCRELTATATFPGFFVDSTTASFPTTVTVTGTSNLDFEATTSDGALVYYEVYDIRTSGTLTVRHVGGTPDDSGALLYDMDTNGELRQIGIDVTRNSRAVVQGDLEPGVYCYRLESVFVDTPVGSPQMRSEFIAR